MLEVAYGHHVTSADDEFIVLADIAIMKMQEVSASLAATLVELLPHSMHAFV